MVRKVGETGSVTAGYWPYTDEALKPYIGQDVKVKKKKGVLYIYSLEDEFICSFIQKKNLAT